MRAHHLGTRLVRCAGALAAASIAALATSCGSGDVAGGGTGVRLASVSYGSISGFGSIVVNGVRYDETAATVSSDEGTTPGTLGLGMVVEVRGDIDSSGPGGAADAITVFSEARGTVTAWSSTGFTLLGLAVRTTANTWYEGVAAVANGDYVAVYGIYDRATGALTATRVELETPAARFKVRGTIGAFDGVARRFQLGALIVDYTGANPVPSGLATGAMVRVHASAEPFGGVLAATRVDLVQAHDLGEGSKAQIDGAVDRFASLADFSVDGVRVDGSNAVLAGGAPSDLGVGRRLEVEGPVQAGMLRASKIRFEDQAAAAFELKGLIADFVDAGHFTVRGTPVDATGSARYEGGSAANLRDGACVEIEGTLQPTSTGSRILATDVHFDSSCR